MCSLTQQSKPVSALAPNRKSSTILKLLMVSQTALHISKKGNNTKSSAKTITLILDWKHILTFSQKFKRTKLFCFFKKARPFYNDRLFALSIDTQVNWFWVTMIVSCKILSQLHFLPFQNLFLIKIYAESSCCVWSCKLNSENDTQTYSYIFQADPIYNVSYHHFQLIPSHPKQRKSP